MVAPFYRLKGCCMYLMTRLELNEPNIPIIFAACCGLHNICKAKAETLPVGWSREAESPSAASEQPDAKVITRHLCGAVCLRNSLRAHFECNGQAASCFVLWCNFRIKLYSAYI